MHHQHKGDSPLVRFLRDPGHSLAHALTAAGQLLERHLPLLLVLVGLALALLLDRLMLTRVRERRLARGPRLIQVAVPPQLEPEGALLLWSAHDLLRPRYARMLAGQPQRAWEIAGDRGGSQFRIWVPQTVPPGLVERALASAWPGIITTPISVTQSHLSAERTGKVACLASISGIKSICARVRRASRWP